MMKILITGVAGFIGFHLCKKLLESESIVVGLDNLNDYYDPMLKQDRLHILKEYKKFDFIKMDIAEDTSIEKIFAEHSPDVVINLAAQAGVRYSIDNPKAYISSNIVGFFNILEACRTNPVKHLVFASSSSVYGNQEKTPFSVEDRVNKPISLYAATKMSDELMAYSYSHLYDIPTTGLRFFTVYGPFGRPDMAYYSFTDKIINNETIKIFNEGDMYRDFTYVDDIIQAINNLIDSPPSKDENGNQYKIYNIGNNKPESIMNFIRVLEKEIGKVAKKEFLPMQPGDVYQTYADVGGLMKDFDFKPKIGIKQGLREFVRWYKNYYR